MKASDSCPYVLKLTFNHFSHIHYINKIQNGTFKSWILGKHIWSMKSHSIQHKRSKITLKYVCIWCAYNLATIYIYIYLCELSIRVLVSKIIKLVFSQSHCLFPIPFKIGINSFDSLIYFSNTKPAHAGLHEDLVHESLPHVRKQTQSILRLR